MQTFSEELFLQVPAVGILRGYSKERVLKIAEVYQEAGFGNLEVTLNTEGAADIISALRKRFDGTLNIGAGTVCSPEDLHQALEAGAQFIVTPIFDLQVVKSCVTANIPVFPGAFSPTEIYQAWTAGARMVKLFPGGALGAKYIKDVLAPLDQIEIMPTGGVHIGNIPEYRAAGAKAFGMGGRLFPKELIQAEDWKGVARHLAEYRDCLTSTR